MSKVKTAEQLKKMPAGSKVTDRQGWVWQSDAYNEWRSSMSWGVQTSESLAMLGVSDKEITVNHEGRAGCRTA